jgi:hypothetical protein
MEPSAARVDASIKLQRALFAIRSALNLDTEEVLKLKEVPPNLAETFEAFRDNLQELRKAWPACSAIECVRIAADLTQAASTALLHKLGEAAPRHHGKSYTKPTFIARFEHSKKQVARATLAWMFVISGRPLRVEPLVARIEDGSLTATAARAFRDQLIKNMPGILQWADDNTAPKSLKIQPERPTMPKKPRVPPTTNKGRVNKNSKLVSVRLPHEMMIQLKRLADQLGRPYQSVMKEAIEKGLPMLVLQHHHASKRAA